MSSVLPYRLYTQAELSLVEAAVQQRCTPWFEAWSSRKGELCVLVRPVLLSDLSGNSWLSSGDCLPVIADHVEAWAFFSRLCLGESKSRAAIERSTLALPVLRSARIELLRALGQSSGVDVGYAEKPVSGEALSPVYSGIGALHLELMIDGSKLSALASADFVESLLPRRKPLPDLPTMSLQTLAPVSMVRLEIRAAAARVSLEDFESLRLGDVLRLDQPIDGAFELRFPDGAVLGYARYGSHRSRPAIKVSRHPKHVKKSGKA